ncbi:MAG: small multi-drug export protein [Halanaerobium sp.]|nr:small multi-drug export protein [Halanaerobium sp.]
MEAIIIFFKEHFTREMAVLLTAAFPFIELRGAVPLAASWGMEPLKAFFLALTGNILPIIPLLLLLDPFTTFLNRRFTICRRFFAWLHHRTLSRSEKVEKYGAIGLIFFTAVPLPTTGAWTACVAAVLFQIPIRYAFPAISTGVVIAGCLLLVLSYGLGGIF